MSIGRFLALGALLARWRMGVLSYGAMQLLGAWMMSTPRSRALAMTSFIRGAISLTRSTARLQWWTSHMSQMMMAVLAAGHVCGRSRTWNRSGSESDGTRSRRTRESAPAGP